MTTLPGDVFAGAGETAALMRTKDWSAAALGPVEGWPQSLKIVVRILLTSRYAMWLGWGPGLTFFYNDAYARMTLGPKHPWALGRSAREVWSEIWDDIGPRIDSVLRTGEATWDERLLLFLERHGYAEETYHTFSYSPVFDDHGAVAGMLCVVTEDTDRVLDERRLRLLRELASDLAGLHTEQELFDAACRRISSCPRDLPFTLTYLAEAGGRARLACATGVEPGGPAAPIEVSPGGGPWPADEALSGRTVTVEDLATRLPGLPAGPRGAAPRQAVVVPLAKQGSDAPAGFFVAGVNPFRRLDASYTGFLNLLVGQVASGLASARAAEAERKRAEALAELDRAKTTFFSNVSHEFRTPLTLMLGPVEDLLARPAGEPSPDGRASLEVVHRNGLRLLRLVNTLLDFSRIEAGRALASYEPTDLAALTADLASNFRSACEKAGLSLVVDCPPLPEPVYVDRDLWEKVVLNLLSNAFKFTLQGEIRVTLRPAAGRADLEVRDTGTGIPQAELPHLFERFHRVEGARGRTQEGTGIGLALVQELVKLHGGAIRADSAAGRGTAFTVSLPLGSDHLPADRVRAGRASSPPSLGAAPFVQEALRWLPSTRHEVGGMKDETRSGDRTAPDSLVHPSSFILHPSSRRQRVLLADDNLDMRDYVRRLLSAEYDVAAVADGRQALDAALAGPPDLVLCDVMMPNLDGFGLLRALRDDPRTAAVPVILLSARAGEEARVEGLRSGADDYLIKPFSARELLARVGGTLALAAARAETANVLESITEGFAAVDADWRYTHVNAQAEKIYRKRRQEMIGKVCWEVFPEAVGTAFEREYRHAMSHRVPVRLEEYYGPFQAWFEVTVYPVKDGGLAFYFRDVSDRKRADEERERLYKAAEAARADAELANRAKDEFLATLSHELRTPLNAILGWARILQLGQVGPDDLREGLEVIERNSKAQAQLIEDLLDLSRIISGKLRLDVQRVALLDVIEQAVAAVAPAAEAKGVRLHRVLDPLAGPVSGDPARLQQVVWNLLSNAVKFTPKGGKVQVVLERVNSHVEISVSDTGQGIRPEFLPHVFDRFRQADSSTTRRHGGLGLGLSIVKQLIEMHGGSVRAKSPGEGQGATFTVSLPVPVVHDAAAGHRPQPAPDHPCPPRTQLGGVKVLVVDDEPDSRELVRRILKACEAEVFTAGSAEEAAAAAERHRPHVLVSDIGMPGQDGYELIRRVRAAGRSAREMPAVALTAFARPEERRRALLAGFQVHIAKPVDPEELVALVASLVGRTGGG